MSDSYRFGPVEVRPAARELRVGGERAEIGPRAFDLLLALIARQGRVATKDELLAAVWPGVVVEENNLAAQVVSLRKVLGARALATIPGRGYQLTLVPDGESRTSERPPPPAVSNVPASRDTLIGRDADIEAAVRMLGERRLVEVLGPGGIGKTRLAQEVARRSAAAFPDGVWWVDLVPVSSAEGIAPAIASAAGVRLSDREGLPQLLQALGKRRVLLVLDNCEHIAAAAAAATSAILEATEEARVLVTSQQVVGATGLGVYRLGTLPVPPAGASLAEARAFGAFQLIEQRARAVDARFTLSEKTLAETIRLCERLDGLPLALEMAAARLPLMGAEALDSHLQRQVGVLRNVNLDSGARHHTLRATLEWSHSLLGEEERRLLRYLSTFAAPFRLECVQAVAADIGLDEVAAIDVFAALVDKSLVQLEGSDPPRYRLLETMRVFAQEELAANDEQAAAWLSHGNALSRLAAEATKVLWDWDVSRWLAAYLPDHADVQAAFDRAFERRDAETLARTGVMLTWLDMERDVEVGVRRRKEAMMALLPSAAPMARAHLLSCLGAFRFINPAGFNRIRNGRDAAAAWAALGDRWRHCSALNSLAVPLAAAGQFDEALRVIEEARALRDPAWPRRKLAPLAFREAQVGMYCRDAAMVREGCETLRRLGAWEEDPRIGAQGPSMTARFGMVAGDADPLPALEAVVKQLRRLDKPRQLSIMLASLCGAHVKAGNLERARAAIAEAMPLAWRQQPTYAIDHLAFLASRSGECARAVRLLGFNDALYVETQDGREWPEALATEEAHRLAEAQLGVEEARRLRAEGSRLSRVEAAAITRELLPQVA